jgi:hypothetical protein
MDGSMPPGFGNTTRHIFELEEVARQGLLSELQVRLFRDRCTNPLFWAYPRIRDTY